MMARSADDRLLLDRCLKQQAGAWKDFVDRFLRLIFHVVERTSQLVGMPLRPSDLEDVAAEVFLQIIKNDFAVLRRFRGQSSLATYLTVIARRVCLHELNRLAAERMPVQAPDRPQAEPERLAAPAMFSEIESREEIEQLLRRLPAPERHVLRLFYLQGHTYQEISSELGIPTNSIGPMLFRARERLRKAKTPCQATE
jgi:RNA polymerase sigma-70 factor (ECF subfamily)